MRAITLPFDPPPLSAYGETEEEVLEQLEVQLTASQLQGHEQVDKYLWSEDFEMGAAKVVVHPETAVHRRRVIGKREVPLRLSYTWSRTRQGGFRVMLPRFDWWFVLEDLEIAQDVLSSAVSGALAGEDARWLYEFRREGVEYVKAWRPTWAKPSSGRGDEEDPFEGMETVRAVADELLDRARKKRLAPAVGRHEEFLPLRALLLARRPTSLLLVGGPGVGKTVWVERLARYLLLEKKRGEAVPRVFSTSRDRIVAGQVYLGMWQARCLALVEELSFEKAYLYVGHLAELVRPMSDGSSIAELFRDAVREEQLSMIAEATESELEALTRRDPALVEAFHVVRVEEPEARSVPQVMLRYLEKKGAPERVRADALVRLVRHLADFVPGQRFPGKAYRAVSWLLQEAGTEGLPLDPLRVSSFFSRYSGLPLELVADEHALSAEDIAARLSARVVGQDEACQVAARAIARLKAGLHDPERPVAALFFVGPTGVGKTELAKQMARYLFGAGPDGGDDRLVRLDMSEYALPGSAQRLLMAEAGAGGQSLAQRVRQQPLAVVLLDEIEKAHSEVFDLLLGLLGEGRMTDSQGRQVDFRMVVFVMTSNLGVTDRAPLGFGEQNGAAGFLGSVRDHFRPELFARLDHVVPFAPLLPHHIERVVDLLVAEVATRPGLARREVKLHVTPHARSRLAELGYDPRRGARPLKRVIEEQVVTPLAVRLAEEPGLQGADVWVVTGGEGVGVVPKGVVQVQLG
ncbi:MAG: ATP-dependent Clp protease ATP-binding subunit [Myxococcales bacterium]|nr:ATP-dependent Clp protease ATP-binding subunit [Myxococcales bacterium]